MFKVIGDNNSDDPKIKRILHILAVILMLSLVLASVLVVKKYKAHQYVRKIDAEKEAQEKAKREDEELAKKGYVKMMGGEVVEIDKENRIIIIISDKLMEGIVHSIKVSENAEIKVFKENIDTNNPEQGLSEEKGTFNSITIGQIADVFFDKRKDPKTQEDLIAQKIELYPNYQEQMIGEFFESQNP